jgi:hypothetical protein
MFLNQVLQEIAAGRASVFLRRKDGLIYRFDSPAEAEARCCVCRPRVVWVGIPIALPFVLRVELDEIDVLSTRWNHARQTAARLEALDCHDSFVVVPSLRLL